MSRWAEEFQRISAGSDSKKTADFGGVVGETTHAVGSVFDWVMRIATFIFIWKVAQVVMPIAKDEYSHLQKRRSREEGEDEERNEHHFKGAHS